LFAKLIILENIILIDEIKELFKQPFYSTAYFRLSISNALNTMKKLSQTLPYSAIT